MKFTELFEDFRGKIMLLEGDMNYPELTVFTTHQGLARGGCIHMLHDEYTTVIEGCVEYCIGGKKRKMKDGDSTVIPKNTPHYFLSLTDSVVLEWGASPEEKKEKHREYRSIVDEINRKACGKSSNQVLN